MTGALRIKANTLLATASLVVGLLMLYGGIGHTIAVIGSKIHGHKPYDYRFVSLLTNGGILTFAGAVDTGLSLWLARGREWAFAWSAATNAALLTYLAILAVLPSAAAAARPALILNGAYFVTLIGVWLATRRRTVRLTSAGPGT